MTASLPRAILALLLFSPSSALLAQDSSTEIATTFRDSVVHLVSGDSLELQGTGPALVPNEAPGLLVTYHPFFDFEDDARLTSAAIALVQTMLPTLPDPPSFIVLRAVDVPASRRNQGGAYAIKAFGVVVERRADGRWYQPRRTTPIF